ncbi:MULTISPECIES: O-antigen ligase [unclassified Marinobacterium]|uniref:O-antigen ligase family protein n=1 Tax=unclassified Marinobacterium TaxID=2644139 RepID=UPI001568C2FC|nr:MULTISPECIES: O-antigen ligase family protein [unclassified Marinobacterium]
MLSRKFKEWWRHNTSVALLGLYFFSLPIGKTLWLPLLAMCFYGFSDFIRHKRQSTLPKATVTWFAISLCFMVPAALSLPDSLAIDRTVKFLVTYPLFAMVGFFLITRFDITKHLKPLLFTTSVISFTWGISAFWQFSLPDFNPFPAPSGARYQGVFGQSDMILGYVLAPIVPLIAYGYWSIGFKKTAVIFSLFLMSVCFISGNRASWVSVLVFLCSVFLFFLVNQNIRKKVKLAFSIAAVMLVIMSGYLSQGTPLGERLNQTLQFFKSPSFSSFDNSSAGRGEIWMTSINIGTKNFWNGTGVGAFRFAYPYYAPDNARFKFPNSDRKSEHKFTGAMYPHQLVLQQFSGAGVFGILGILIFYSMLLYATVKSLKHHNLLVFGLTAAIWSGFFPLNTHLNFHGGWLTASFWVWVGLLLSMLNRKVDSKGNNA